jgi:hypothetical protein
MADAEHYRDGYGDTSEERLHCPGEQKPGQQRIGKRDQDTGENGHCSQAADPFGQSVKQLAAVFERNEGSARPGKGEGIGSNHAAVLEHVPAVCQVSRQVSVGIQQWMLQHDRDHHHEEHKYQRRGSRSQRVTRLPGRAHLWRGRSWFLELRRKPFTIIDLVEGGEAGGRRPDGWHWFADSSPEISLS